MTFCFNGQEKDRKESDRRFKKNIRFRFSPLLIEIEKRVAGKGVKV